MDKVRIGAIGLGWLGEIQCEAIIGIANRELARSAPCADQVVGVNN